MRKLLPAFGPMVEACFGLGVTGLGSNPKSHQLHPLTSWTIVMSVGKSLNVSALPPVDEMGVVTGDSDRCCMP